MITPPIVLDLEASGFGRGSYPIEVGLAMTDGHLVDYLIKPFDDLDALTFCVVLTAVFLYSKTLLIIYKFTKYYISYRYHFVPELYLFPSKNIKTLTIK